MIGGFDSMVLVNRSAKSAIPSAILKLMPDVAHFPPREAPDAFNAFPGGFLAESNAEIV